MRDPKAEFEETVASLFNGKRGSGNALPDEASRFVGSCLLTLGNLLAEAIAKDAVDRFADVLAWQLSIIGTESGPRGAAGVRGLLDWHLKHMAGAGTKGRAGRFHGKNM